MATGVVLPAVLTALLAACSGSSSDGDASDAASSDAVASPRQVYAGLPAPAGTTYIAESAVGTTGYWVAYGASDVNEDTLSSFADTLKVEGWTSQAISDDGFRATTDGAWLDVVVSGDGVDDSERLFVCVWNTKPKADECADFPASLSEIPTKSGA